MKRKRWPRTLDCSKQSHSPLPLGKTLAVEAYFERPEKRQQEANDRREFSIALPQFRDLLLQLEVIPVHYIGSHNCLAITPPPASSGRTGHPEFGDNSRIAGSTHEVSKAMVVVRFRSLLQ